jgi:transposase-like protein
MSPRKLTEDDKQEILQLYRTSGATTSTLALQYGVSSSTVSRFLKNELSQSEYEDLIQQKRLARTPRGEKSAATHAIEEEIPLPEIFTSIPLIEEPAPEKSTKKISKVVTRRRRSKTNIEEPELPTTDEIEAIQEEPVAYQETLPLDLPEIDRSEKLDVLTLEEMLGEDIDDEDDLDDDEDNEDDDEDWDADTDKRELAESVINIRILPLSNASFPKTCYLVVDRASELIVRPLEDFADLGSIPATEIQQQTLPVFDNHRVAKRFSHRRERVIKVPDGKMLQKTSHHLQAKGITRLLIDGRIYALSKDQ